MKRRGKEAWIYLGGGDVWRDTHQFAECPSTMVHLKAIYLPLTDKLHQDQLYQSVQLDGGRHVSWAACTYLEKFFRFGPPFQSCIRYSSCVMVYQIIIVSQVRKRQIYGRDGLCKDGKCGIEKACGDACLIGTGSELKRFSVDARMALTRKKIGWMVVR